MLNAHDASWSLKHNSAEGIIFKCNQFSGTFSSIKKIVIVYYVSLEIELK